MRRLIRALILMIIAFISVYISDNIEDDEQNMIKGGYHNINKDTDMIKKQYIRHQPRTVKCTGILPDVRDCILRIAVGYSNPTKIINLFLEGYTKEHGPTETLDDIKTELPYENTKSVMRLGTHNGQRKLLLTEIQFLTNVRNSGNKYCLYAGSAPGNKTFYLSTLFPDITFILIDPNKFDLKLDDGSSHRYRPHPNIVHLVNKSSPDTADLKCNIIKTSDYLTAITSADYKIFIIQDFMTNEIAKELKALDIVFISDIRSNIHNKAFPMDFDIYWNNSMMFNWINIMRPHSSMLKIRTPYLDENKNIEIDDHIKADFEQSKGFGLDILADYKAGRMILPTGRLFVQAWAPKSSTEMRLVIKESDINKPFEYDLTQIESKLFYYNVIERTWFYHTNPNADPRIGFCNCGDCSLENKIWTDYGYSPKEIKTAVVYIGNMLKRPLSSTHTNTIYKPRDKQSIDKILLNWKPPKAKGKYKNQKGNTGK
jgi:hypothetical protein